MSCKCIQVDIDIIVHMYMYYIANQRYRFYEQNDAQDNLLLPEIPLPLCDIDCVHLGPIPELIYMVDNEDIASFFYNYKIKSKEIISKGKMFQETDLHELL